MRSSFGQSTIKVTLGAVLATVLVAGLPTPAGAHHKEFVDKTERGVTGRVSVSSQGQEGDYHSGNGCGAIGYSVSDDGRFVAFSSQAGNLHPADANGQAMADVFVLDRKKRTLDLASVLATGLAPELPVTPGGAEAACALPGDGTPNAYGTFYSRDPVLSGNGRYVAFVSNLPLTEAEDLGAGALPFAKVFVRDLKKGITRLVSVTADGAPALGSSGQPSISKNGRFIAFTSEASNITEDGCASTTLTCEQQQRVFLRDIAKAETLLVSRSSDGEPANGPAAMPGISGDGRVVAFESGADNLVEGDLNGLADVFVHVVPSGKTELISVSREGLSSNLGALVGTNLSSDGRFVSFSSPSTDLVPANLPLAPSCSMTQYIRDRKTQRTERASVTSTGMMVRGGGAQGCLSDDGRYLLINALADGPPDLTSIPPRVGGICPDTTDRAHVFSRFFIHDLATGQSDWALVDIGGHELGAEGDEGAPSDVFLHSAEMSGDARTLVGWSDRSDTVKGDTNDSNDVFVRDIERRGLSSGFLSTQPNGMRNPIMLPAGTRIGSDGVAILDDASDDALVGGLGAEILQTRIAHRPDLDDLYIKIDVDRLATPTSVIGLLGASMLYAARFTIGDSTYELRAQGIGGPMLQGGGSFGLFDCTAGCAEITALKGGYGTVGENIVASIPIRHLGLQRGGDITDLEVFAGPGSYLLGVTRLLDAAGA